MPRRPVLRVYYHQHLVAQARDGRHNFTNRLRAAVDRVGVELRICTNSPLARGLSAVLPGRALFHMDAPFHRRALTLRLAYLAPFWRIENTAKRWEFAVARAPFRPETVDSDQARRFQRRLAIAVLGDHAGRPGRGGMIYMPLQGVIRRQRSFQHYAPLDMVRQTLEQRAGRRVVIGLHPNESYSNADRRALADLAEAHPGTQIVTGRMAPLLADCDMVVTLNSSVALFGFLIDKPAVLCAQVDFHHIALNAAQMGLSQAIAAAPTHRSDYARYLLWFLKQTTINAGAPNAEDQILAALRHHGWQL